MEFDFSTHSVLIDPGAVGRAQVFDENFAIIVQRDLSVKSRRCRVAPQDDVAFLTTDGDGTDLQ